MRFLPFKIMAWSWLGITLTLRRFFIMLFILSLGLAIGVTGLYKEIQVIKDNKLIFVLVLGGIIVSSLVLWMIFFSVHRARRNKEGMHYMVEYLEELRDNGVITERNFIKEKEKIIGDFK